tara:strand:- start:280 stop:615 length:336 start_codon:yes stop_codon:yes gene_type:complete
MVEKFKRDGMVAIIISPGFGAGWSTWNQREDIAEFLLFDKTLVQYCKDGADITLVRDHIYSKFDDANDYVSLGGWEQADIRWLDEGTHFSINDYDGSESVQVRDDEYWRIA